MLPAGVTPLQFSCESGNPLKPRARVTVFSQGDELRSSASPSRLNDTRTERRSLPVRCTLVHLAGPEIDAPVPPWQGRPRLSFKKPLGKRSLV